MRIARVAGVQPHVHVLFPGPGTGHPAGGQRLAAQGRDRVSGLRGAVRRSRQLCRRPRPVQAAVRSAALRAAVSPRAARVRRRHHRHRRSRHVCGHRRGGPAAATPDLHVNEQNDRLINNIYIFVFLILSLPLATITIRIFFLKIVSNLVCFDVAFT